VGVTFNGDTGAYRIRIWDDGAQAILGTDKTGTKANVPDIGSSDVNLGYNNDGLLDEMAVFNDVLTSNEIDQIRQGAQGSSEEPNEPSDLRSDPNCVASWRFEDGALTADSTGTNTLSNNGVSSQTVDYQDGLGCADFELSESDSMGIQNTSLSSDYPFKSGTTNRKISVCFWTKFESLPGAYETDYLYAKWGSVEIVAYNNGTTTNLYALIFYNDGQNYEAAQHTGALSAGVWYHVGVTIDGTTGAHRIRIWDDNANAFLGTDCTGTFTNLPSPDLNNISIGLSHDGLLDDMAVFNDILSADEIDQVRQGPSGSSSQGETVYLKSITYNSRGLKATERGPYPEGATTSELQVNYSQYFYDNLGRQR